jgi:hypothetical protein
MRSWSVILGGNPPVLGECKIAKSLIEWTRLLPTSRHTVTNCEVFDMLHDQSVARAMRSCLNRVHNNSAEHMSPIVRSVDSGNHRSAFPHVQKYQGAMKRFR